MAHFDKFYMEEITLESKDPMELFRRWYADAKSQRDVVSAEQMTLATVRKDGGPSARTVLMRGLDNRGFKMYWDSRSRKSSEVEEDTRGALVFVWYFRDKDDKLGFKQVRVEGNIERLPRDEEKAYFNTEPVAAKIRATVCHQSSVVCERQITLDASQQLLDKVKEGYEIPIPDTYCGYQLVPHSMEFYQGCRDTINDRIKFFLVDDNTNIDNFPEGTYPAENGWMYQRLQP